MNKRELIIMTVSGIIFLTTTIFGIKFLKDVNNEPSINYEQNNETNK